MSNELGGENSPPIENLDDIKNLLKQKAREILFARAEQVPALQLEIQRLRIAAALYREIEQNEINRDLYKEMNLLNRMTTGRDLEQEADRKTTEESIERAAGHLRDGYGVGVASANRIARALSSVVEQARGMDVLDDGDDSPEPEPEPFKPAGE